MSERTSHDEDLAEVREELAVLRAQLDRLQTDGARRRGRVSLGRRRHTSPDEQPSSLLSRRRLFGLVGGAAAAGAGLAVVGSTLGAEPAAASTDMVIGGGAGSNNAGTENTDLTADVSSGTTLTVENTDSTSGTAIQGEADSSGGTGVNGVSDDGTGVSGHSNGTGKGVQASSATGNSLVVEAPSSTGTGTQLLVQPGSVTGPPTGGPYALGNVWLDSAGTVWAYTGSTWVSLSLFVAVNPPARVYDSRIFGGPLGSNVSRNVTVSESSVSAVLCNLTAAEPTGAGFLAMFEADTIWSGTSNLNFNPGQDVSNNVTSAVSAAGQVAVYNGGPPTNFVVDVFGYYT